MSTYDEQLAPDLPLSRLRLQHLVASFREWRMRRRRIQALSGLSDHMLRDIGMTPSDIFRRTR
jgi:uncharacterized protein YjiS (DUF1127 family)